MYEISAGMLYFYDIVNINKMIEPSEIEVNSYEINIIFRTFLH